MKEALAAARAAALAILCPLILVTFASSLLRADQDDTILAHTCGREGIIWLMAQYQHGEPEAADKARVMLAECDRYRRRVEDANERRMREEGE